LRGLWMGWYISSDFVASIIRVQKFPFVSYNGSREIGV
jgi:hypothetical protein